MASAIELLVSTELYHILKSEWIVIYIEVHDEVFCLRNIQAGFHGTDILLFNPDKVFE